jgi:hypothetical protein
VICDNATSTFAFGWKYTRITETPLYDCDSMCSMSLTVVVIARSKTVTIRFSISSGDSPL